jgi:lipoic acid synthetase
MASLYRTAPRIFRSSSAPAHRFHRSFATTIQDAPVASRISSADSPSQSSLSAGPAGYTRRPGTTFSNKLNAGPNFGDFVTSKSAAADGEDAELSLEDALELRETAEVEEAPRIGHASEGRELRKVLVGPEGRKREVTRLPEWLKTPIPSSENFKKIKGDLRGLGLHTGRLFFCFWFVRSGSVRSRMLRV